MNATPPKIIYIVVVSIASLAFIGVSALSASLFIKNYADPAILTALISITSGAVGSLGSLLVSSRTTPVPPKNGPNGVPVTVNQPTEKPIPVEVKP
jgi:hypothetical protein